MSHVGSLVNPKACSNECEMPCENGHIEGSGKSQKHLRGFCLSIGGSVGRGGRGRVLLSVQAHCRVSSNKRV